MEDDHRTLEEKHKARRYIDYGRIITITHINQKDGPGGCYFEAFFSVDEPENGSTGHGTCSLSYLEGLPEACVLA